VNLSRLGARLSATAHLDFVASSVEKEKNDETEYSNCFGQDGD
jgi:hypothetical protein